jgi:hypothetical protein
LRSEDWWIRVRIEDCLGGAPVQNAEKYFRYLWRFNAVVMAVIGFAVVIAFVANLFSPFWNASHSGPAGNFAPVPKSAEHGYTYRLARDAIRLSGTREEIFALRRWKGDLDDGASSSGAQDVNLLVVDDSSAASHWLFRGTGRTILSRDEVHASDVANYNAYSPVVALVLTVLDADTNRDGKIDGKDRESLYVYRVGSAFAVEFFTADHILAAQQVGSDRYLVIYEDGNKAAAQLFSMLDFKPLSQEPLPDVPE